MKRFISLLIFLICLCAFTPVFAFDTYYEQANWILPVANMKGGYQVTSRFGFREQPENGGSTNHGGIDIAAGGTGYCGGNAIATAAGYVDGVEWLPGYGLSVWVLTPHPSFPDGLYILYAHGARALVSEGENVYQGQPLTEIEDENQHGTGLGYVNPHLHFEIRTSYDGTKLDPALFVADLAMYSSGETMQVGVPYRTEHGGVFEEFNTILFEFKYEMIKGFRSIFEGVANAIIAGYRYIHSIIRNLFILLIMIDLALGTMNVTFGDKDTELFRFLLGKFLFYGIMLLMIDKWPDLANHFVKDYFMAGSANVMSMTEAEVASVISDPMLILEKGLHIIQPLVNNALSFHFPEKWYDWIFFMLPGSSIVTFIFTAIGILVFLILLFLLAVLIALAYLEFYIFMLFAFSTLIFAGTHATRQTRLANRGITSVFAGALNLMFYAMLAVLITQSMNAIASQAQASEIKISKPAEGISIVNVGDLRNRIRVQETGIPPNYQSTGGGNTDADGTDTEYYGAFHIRVSDWESWTEEAYNDGAPLIESSDGGGYPTPNCKFKWTPENQEILVLWKLQKEYDKTGSWEQAAHEFYNHSGPHDKSWNEYWKAVSKQTNDGQPQKVPTKTNSLLIIIQLNICLLVFVVLAIRMSSSIQALFKNGGFELLNSQNDQ